MGKRSPLAWTAEIATQALFYSSPWLFDFPGKIHYIAKNWFNGDYAECMNILTLLVLAFAWTLPSVVYFTLYKCQFKCIEKYRTQEWVWNLEDSPRKTSYMEVVKKTAETLVVGQLGLMSVGTYFLFRYLVDTTDDIAAYIDRLPHWSYAFGQLMIGCFIFETTFYWFHRFLHTKIGYQFHKQHHFYTVPISAAGLWGHTIDGLLSLPIPGIMPIFLLDMHLITFWLWIVLNVFHSSYDHCGYYLPYDPFNLIPFGAHADAHNYHHSHMVDNYGLYWRLWDIIMGTNQHWEQFKAERDTAVELLRSGKGSREHENFKIMEDGSVLVKAFGEKHDINGGPETLKKGADAEAKKDK